MPKSSGMGRFRKRDDLVAVSVIAFDYLAIFTFAGVAIYVNHWAVSACAIVLIAGRQVAFLNLAHAATHHALFRSKRWNDSIDLLIGYPIFDSVVCYRGSHLQHHAEFSRMAPERFEYLHGELRLPEHGPWGRIWIVFIRSLAGYNGLCFLWATAWYLRQNRSFALKLVLYWLVLLGVCYWVGCLTHLLLYWVLPLVWLYPVFNMWAEISDHFQTNGVARNHSGLFNNLLIKPHELYHHTHHLYPAIPFYRLKEATEHLLQEGQMIDHSASFIDFVKIVFDQTPATRQCGSP